MGVGVGCRVTGTMARFQQGLTEVLRDAVVLDREQPAFPPRDERVRDDKQQHHGQLSSKRQKVANASFGASVHERNIVT